MISNIDYRNLILYLVLASSILVGYYFGEDSSGSGGFINDFYNTWPIVENIKSNFFSDFSPYTIHFPLHYYILYFVEIFVQNKESTRLFFCIFSLFIPFIFFLVLKDKFKEINPDKLFLFSQILFILPSFRSGAIWANSQITSIIFLIISILFFVKWENKNIKNFTIDIFFQILFLSLAVYSRQLYALLFVYILFIYFKKLSFTEFFKTIIFSGIFALPGLFLVVFFPDTLSTTFDFKFQNSLLVNLSIISFYILPFLIVSDYKKFIPFLYNKKNYIILFLFLVVTTCLVFYFSYNPYLGGGFFIKLSLIIFDNLYFFYLTSLLGMIVVYFSFLEERNSLILFSLLILGFSSYQIFQKYFEPMLIILIFTIVLTNYSKMILKSYKKILIFKSYFFLYLASAIINDFFQITKNLS